MEIRNGIQYIKPPMIEVPAGEFLMGAIQTQTSPLLLIRAVPSGRGKRDRCDRLERLGTDDRYHARWVPSHGKLPGQREPRIRSGFSLCGVS